MISFLLPRRLANLPLKIISYSKCSNVSFSHKWEEEFSHGSHSLWRAMWVGVSITKEKDKHSFVFLLFQILEIWGSIQNLEIVQFITIFSLLIRRLYVEIFRTKLPIQLKLGLKILFILMFKLNISSFQNFPRICFFVQWRTKLRNQNLV